MTTAKEIITSLSIGFSKACAEYNRAIEKNAPQEALDMYFNFYREAKNALMYYVAGYYRDSEQNFYSDTCGSWHFKQGREILAIGYSDSITFDD